MKKTVTIKENRDFQRMYRRGKSAAAGTLVVYHQKNRQGASRLGITTSTKLGKAVVRNRVRRQIREIYRLNRDKLRSGNDIIIVARVRAVSAGYHAMEKDYLRLLKKLGLLNSEFGIRNSDTPKKKGGEKEKGAPNAGAVNGETP